MAENQDAGLWKSYPEFEGSVALRWAGCRVFSLQTTISAVRPIVLAMSDEGLTSEPSEEPVAAPYVGISGASYRPATNYQLQPGELTSALSPLRRADANLAAIELLKALEAEQRPATETEQRILVQYAGWGGLPNAFRRPDGSVADGWSDIVRRLQDLLTHEEFTSARQSTLDAFFTPENVVRAVWRGLVASGFHGGRMLETSCGTGNFIGTAPDGTQVDAIEADAITSSIARHCYPEHHITSGRLEGTPLRDNHYILAIGNPPFSQQRLSGSAPMTELMRAAYNTHSYFIARAVEATQTGGVVAQVVSRYLMDSAAPDAVRFRDALSARCDLITAIRLPGEAFKENAGTDVITDILVLQKRPPDMTATQDAGWVRAEPWPLTYSSAGVENTFDAPVNEWFHRRPHHILGDLAGVMGRFGDGDMVIRPAPDWSDRMESLLMQMPRTLFSYANEEMSESQDDAIHVPSDVARDKAPGDLFLMPEADGWRILRMEPPYMGVRRASHVPADYFGSASGTDKAIRLLTLHATLLSVIDGQMMEHANDAALEADRARLRAQYEAFVADYGYLRSVSNAKALRGDMAYATLRGLETSYDKGVSAAVAAKSGTQARPASATPSAILSTRTQYPVQAVDVASDAMTAFSLCLSQYGKLDVAWIARALHRQDEWNEIREEIGDRMFYDFESMQWEPSSTALSGDVVTKLEQLDERMAAPPSSVDGDFFHRESLRLRAALVAVQPERIRISDISPNPGAPWIPPEIVAEFIHKIVGRNTGSTRYNEFLSKWELPNDSAYFSGNSTWGGATVSAVRLLNAVLNHVPIVITDRVYPDKTVINADKTALANDYLTKVVEEWDTWITSDTERCLAIEAVYNQRFNRHVAPHYDGSHLTLQGSSDEVTLRPTQKNFVWRTCLSRGTLADHAVGAGKTFAAIAAVMENRRLRLARKAMIVVPNHLVDQWESAYRLLYPTAKLLVATPDSMSASNRPAFLSQIASSTIDACIMPHSSFSLIPGDPDFIAAYVEDQISDLDRELMLMNEAGSPSKQTTKQMERSKKALHERLHKRLSKAAEDRASQDRGLNFGDLGVDMLVVDESHLFKNVPFQTDMKNVKGLGNPIGSRRAEDMMMKVHFLQQRNGRVLFLSGTPISNSLAEFYLLQRYFQSNELKKLGIRSFDAWAATFARVSHGFQFTLAGQFKEQSYLNQFNSLDVLRDMANQFSDVVTTKDVSRLMEEAGMGVLRLPPLSGGKTQIVVSQMTPMQRKIFGVETPDSTAEHPIYEGGSILHRLDNLPTGRPEKGSDNILVIISDMKKTALDARTINPLLPMESQGKIADCLENLKSVYHEFSSVRGTQIVFLDMSTPKSGSDAEVISLVSLSESSDPDVAEAATERLSAYTALEIDAILSRADKHTFSAYMDIRQRLIASGIPDNEIAFVHDFDTADKKQRMQQDMNAGRIRILLGSTSKLGAGSNVQERLVAVHHLDIPYRPSDIEQRNGRILRQGNLLLDLVPDFSVRIFQYVTEGSGDAGAAQIIENKQIMLNILRDSKLGSTLDDAEQNALDPAAIKAMASGNELLVEEVELSAYIKKASRLQRSIEQDNASIRYGTEQAVASLNRSMKHVANLSRLMASVDGFQARIDAHEKVVVARHNLSYANGELVIPKPSGAKSDDAPRLTKKQLESELAFVPLFRRDAELPPVDVLGEEFNDHVKRMVAAGIRANQRELMMWRNVPLQVGLIGDFVLSVTIKRSDSSDREMLMVVAIQGEGVDLTLPTQSYHESVQWDRRFRTLMTALPKEMDYARAQVQRNERDVDSYAHSIPKQFGREAELAEARCRHQDIVAALRAGCKTHAQWESVRHEKALEASAG